MSTAQQEYEKFSEKTNIRLKSYPMSLPTCYFDPWRIAGRRGLKRDFTKENHGVWPSRLLTKVQDESLERAEKLGLLRMRAKREQMRARKQLKKSIEELEELERECNPYNQEEEPWFTGECGRDSYKADFCTHCEVEGKSCRPKAVADAEKEVVSCSSESVVDAVERATVCMECGLDFIICTCRPEPKKEDFIPPVPQEAPPVVREEEIPVPWAKFSNVCADRREEDGTRCHEFPAYTGSGFANGVALCNKHWKTRTRLPWPGDFPLTAEPASVVPVVPEEVQEEPKLKQAYSGKVCDFYYKARFFGFATACDSKETYFNKELRPRCCVHWDFVKDGRWPGGCDYSVGPAILGGKPCGRIHYKVKRVDNMSPGVENTGRPFCEEHWKEVVVNKPFVCDFFEPAKKPVLERKNAFIENADGTIILPPPAPAPSRRLHAFCADCKRVYDIRIQNCVNCGEATAIGRKEDIARAFGKPLAQMAWLSGSTKRFCEGCRVTKTMRRYDEEGKEEKLCYVCRQHPKPNKFAFIV